MGLVGLRSERLRRVQSWCAFAAALSLIACASNEEPGAPLAGSDGGVAAAVDRDAGSATAPDARMDPGLSRPDAGAAGRSDAGNVPSPADELVNQGWVGGACNQASDCDSPDFTEPASCLVDGFQNGMCTQPCRQSSGGSWLCPDTDYGEGAPNTITRCVTTDTLEPTCASQCDFDLSPTGCRAGYQCVMRLRHGSAQQAFPVCLPNGRWPGESAPGFDIGETCSAPADCANSLCLNLGSGYCSKGLCDQTGCPDGSACYTFETAEMAVCLKSCQGDRDCDTGNGQSCVESSEACLPAGPMRQPWDSSVGAGGCRDAWGRNGSGLSPCDTTPDDYIVVHKAARNLALCHRGALVQNFHMGLGFAPSGDKDRQGDGKTPEGVFFIPRVVPVSSYYKAFLVSYPDANDASRGVSAGLISDRQRQAILDAQRDCTEPPQDTSLGGLIEVHGHGGGVDWTWGCMAVEDAEVDVLWGALEAHDTIVIRP